MDYPASWDGDGELRFNIYSWQESFNIYMAYNALSSDWITPCMWMLDVHKSTITFCLHLKDVFHWLWE